MSLPHQQRLLIVDDHPLFRKGVSYLVSQVADFCLVGEAASGREAIAKAQALQPDIILLDLNMKGMNGIETLTRMKEQGLEARVVMLTVSDQAEDLVSALRAGADGYLLKEMEPEDLLAKLEEVAAGQISLSERLVNLLAYTMRQQAQPQSWDEAALTEQERRVLESIASGKSNKQVARELKITEGTVKVHVKHLLRKLNLRSRVEAVVWFIQQQKR